MLRGVIALVAILNYEKPYMISLGIYMNRSRDGL